MDEYVCRHGLSERQKLFIHHDNNWTSSAEEFWLNNVLSKSSGIDQIGDFLAPQYAAFVLAQLFIYFVLIKGDS